MKLVLKFHPYKLKLNMRILIVVLFALVLVSCGGSKKKMGLNENCKLKKLTCVDSLTTFLGLPTTIKLFDDKLFIVDMFDEKEIVKIVDLKNNQVLYSFAKKGEGPYEYLHINDIDFFKDSIGRVKLNIYDPVSSKLGTYDYDSLLIMKNEYIPSFIYSINKGVRMHEMFKVNEGYIATGLTVEGKYTFLSDSLKIKGYFGNYRPKPMESIPDMSHILANYGKSVLSYDKDILVEIIYNACVLSCYDINNQGLSKRWENVIHDLDYRMDGESIVNNAEMGYLSACICNKNIYALYSGAPDNLNAVATYGNEIHVYDLNGNIIDRLNISKPAFAIAVDEFSKKIYVLSHIPEPNITVFNID